MFIPIVTLVILAVFALLGVFYVSDAIKPFGTGE